VDVLSQAQADVLQTGPICRRTLDWGKKLLSINYESDAL